MNHFKSIIAIGFLALSTLWAVQNYDNLKAMYLIETIECPEVNTPMNGDFDTTLTNQEFTTLPVKDFKKSIDMLLDSMKKMALMTNGQALYSCLDTMTSSENVQGIRRHFYILMAACPELDANVSTLAMVYQICPFEPLKGMFENKAGVVPTL